MEGGSGPVFQWKVRRRAVLLARWRRIFISCLYMTEQRPYTVVQRQFWNFWNKFCDLGWTSIWRLHRHGRETEHYHHLIPLQNSIYWTIPSSKLSSSKENCWYGQTSICCLEVDELNADGKERPSLVLAVESDEIVYHLIHMAILSGKTMVHAPTGREFGMLTWTGYDWGWMLVSIVKIHV